MRLLDRFLPEGALARSLVVQSVLSAFGTGSFLTGTAVFFTRVVGLSAAQVGLGMSVAGLVVFVLAVPLGRLADILGTKRLWVLGSAIEAGCYLLWPLLRGFVPFISMLCFLAIVETAARSGRDAYRLAIFSREERVRTLAFFRAARNVGYTLGAAAGGLALAIGTRTAVLAIPVVTAAVLVVNAAMVARLPVPDVDARPTPAPDPSPNSARSGLRNTGFVVLAVMNGILNTNQVLLNVVVPLWLVERTDAPHTLLAWLFGTNTVLAVLLQVPASRGAETVNGCLRAVRRSALCFVVSCFLIAITHDTIGWASILLIWLGHDTITGAELWVSAAGWGFVSELSDPNRLGEYQGVWNLGFQVEPILGPAVFTYLAMNVGWPGWAAIAAIAVLAAAISHPAARAAQRHAKRFAPEPV